MVLPRQNGAIADPRAFIHPCPHMSFVWGEENVAFLRARYAAMAAHHCHQGMEYSEFPKQSGFYVHYKNQGHRART